MKIIKIKKILSISVLFFLVILLAVFLRVFIFEVYSIPSGSMEETLVPGDRIVVSKLAYGAALPRSPLEVPWFNAFFLLSRRAIAANDTFVWHYRRLPGFGTLQRGDVTVFRYPADPHQTYIKRCVALPGDTVQVKEGILCVNGRAQPFPATARNEYRMWFRDEARLIKILDSLHIPIPVSRYRRDSVSMVLDLTLKEKSGILRSGAVDSMKLYVMYKDRSVVDGDLPLTNEMEADRPPDFFGPLVVPRRGMTIPVNAKTLQSYATVLERYEHFVPERRDSLWLWRGRPVRSYTFRQDYYFMMGDNRHNSTDSRWWGVVPEELVIGKAEMVLWSGSFRHFRWGRMLKKIE